MIDNKRIVVIMPIFNEKDKIGKVIDSVSKDLLDEIVVINDGSTDGSDQEARDHNATVLSNKVRKGIGAAIRLGIDYAKEKKFNILTIMSGSGKDDGREIIRLVSPIVNEHYDFVQGSRYLRGGRFNKIPLHRTIVTRVYPLLVRLVVNIYQEWLDGPLEYYLTLKIIKLGYKAKEVPVSKIYPENVSYSNYTKVRPLKDWAERLKPIIYLTTNIRK
jgi:dolichol-phosphate mannosyltransferase